jgi:hypothetical protein
MSAIMNTIEKKRKYSYVNFAWGWNERRKK